MQAEAVRSTATVVFGGAGGAAPLPLISGSRECRQAVAQDPGLRGIRW